MIDWDNYRAAAHFLVFEEFIGELDMQANKKYVGLDMRNTIRDYLRKCASPESKLNIRIDDQEDERDQTVVFLSSCLSDVNQLQATDPRDKVYGLHALYTDLGIPLPAVDYTKSLSQVYEEAAVAMITWSATLKVFGDACHSNRNTSFPSWVPDWSDGNLKIFTPTGNATKESKITGPSPKILNAIPGQLRVQGIIVGTVLTWRKERSCTPTFPTRLEQDDLPIVMATLPGLTDDIEDLEALRLAIARINFFRQLYNL